MSEKVELAKLAKVIRSKNAGPFMTTIDIFFEDRKAYNRVKESRVINTKQVAELYNIPVEHVRGIFYYDQAQGIKVTILKPPGMASGDPRCTDIFGASQHVPLRSIKIS